MSAGRTPLSVWKCPRPGRPLGKARQGCPGGRIVRCFAQVGVGRAGTTCERSGLGPSRSPRRQRAALRGTGANTFLSKATGSRRRLLNCVGKDVCRSIRQSYRNQTPVTWSGSRAVGGPASRLLLWGGQSTMHKTETKNYREPEKNLIRNIKAITRRLSDEG